MKYFKCECIDKQTGHTFDLRLNGNDIDSARLCASGWGFITSKLVPCKPDTMQVIPGATKLRLGNSVPVSKVSDVTRKQDFNMLIAVHKQACDYVDRHFYLQNLAELAYKLRDDRADALHWSERACWQWLMESQYLIPALREEFKNPHFVRILLPKRLIIILKKAGHPERAQEVAKKCQSLDLCSEDIAYLSKQSKAK